MAALMNPSINPPLLVSPVKRTPHPRSPSHSPVRQNYRDSDPLLRSLSPTTTLEAFTSDPQMIGQHGPLAVKIGNASTSERTLGTSAARACLDLRSWTRELENWDWPDTFDVPAPARKRMRLAAAEPKNRSGPAFEMDDGQGEYWGSLPAKQVVSLEQRITEIISQRDKIDVEELKDFALNAHIGVESGRVSRNDSLADFGAAPLDMRRLDDCTALITATVMQALPFLSRLNTLLDMWNIRLSILRAVPSYLHDLNNLKIDLDQGWTAIGQSRSPGEQQTEPATFTRETMKAMKTRIEQQVQSLGTRLDGFLDTLEGRVETVPGNWIDEFETLETAYGDWVVDAERKVMRSEWQTARGVPAVKKTQHLTSDHTRNASLQTISHFVEDHDRDGDAVATPSSKPTKSSPVVLPAELSAGDSPLDRSTLTLPRSNSNISENGRKKSPQRARYVAIDIDDLRSTYANPSEIIPGDDSAPTEPVVEPAKPQVQAQPPPKKLDLGPGPPPPTVKQRTNAFLNAEIERSNSLQKATKTPVRSFEHANNAFIRLFKKDKERSPGLYGMSGGRNSMPARTSPNRMSRTGSTKDDRSSIPVRAREKSLSPVRTPRADADGVRSPRHRSASPERRSMHDRRMTQTTNSANGQSGIPRRPDSPLKSGVRPESTPNFPARSTSLPRGSRGSPSPSPTRNARRSIDVSRNGVKDDATTQTGSPAQATPSPTRPPPAIPVDQITAIAEEPSVAGSDIPDSKSAATKALQSRDSLPINGQQTATLAPATGINRTESTKSPLSEDFDISEGEIHQANAIEYSVVESSPARSQTETPTVRRPSSSHAAKLKLITSPGLLDPDNKLPPRTIIKRASCASIEIHPRSRVRSIDIGPRTPASARSIRSNSMSFSRSPPQTPMETSGPLSAFEPLPPGPLTSNPIAPEALHQSVNAKSKLPVASPPRRKTNERLGEMASIASPGSPGQENEGDGLETHMNAPLNAAMKKRQSGMHQLAGRQSQPHTSPKKATQAPLVPEDSFDRHVSEVLDALPAARIRFRQMNRPETPVSSFRADARPRPKSRISSGSSYAPSVNSGGMTITPAELSPKKTASVVDPVKLYHLRTEGREEPIKLFVRLVGEGERVMVRVGGGWADLADYLKKYAEHHTSRTVSGSGPPLEVMNAEANGAGSTANLQRISVLSGDGSRKSSGGGWDPFGSASAAIRGAHLTSPPPLTPTGALSRLENRDDGEDFLGFPTESSPLEHEEPSSVKRSHAIYEEEAATPQQHGSSTPIFETPSRPATSSSTTSFARSVASALPPHLRTPEVSLSGPAPSSTQNRPKSAATTELEQRKAKWVEGMIEQARASAEKAKSTATNDETNTAGSGSKKKGLFHEMGKIGGTRRVIFRSSATPNTKT